MPERLQISDWHKEARCFPADWSDHHDDLDDALIHENWTTLYLDVSAPTINELIRTAADEFLCGEKDYYLNEEDGTLTVYRMETGKGDVATPSEEEAWRKGEIKLWDCSYFGTIERITPYQEEGS